MKHAFKRTLGLLLVSLLLCGIAPLTTSAAGVDITAKFTDPEFRYQVYFHIGKTEPEPILDSDVAAITELSVSSWGIQSLAGLEYFTNLITLRCYGNQLTSLPKLPVGLKSLDCFDNQLTVLPALPAGLLRLACWNNHLTALPALPASLQDFQCSNNKLTGMDLSPCKALTNLDCRYNNMTSKNAVKGFSRWDDGEYGFFKYEPQNVPQVSHFWDSWSPFMQWVLKYILFGWIWMAF